MNTSGAGNHAAFNMAAYVIGRAAKETPDATALIVLDAVGTEPAEIWTFAQLQEATLRIAGGLQRMGLSRGDRILIRLENTSTYALLFFGAIAGGFVPLPTSAQLTEREAHFLLEDSGAAAVALGQGLEFPIHNHAVRVLSTDDISRLMRDGPRVEYAPTVADDPAFLIYTSGTTASPKGVLHAQRSALGRRPMYQGWYGISGADRMLHAGAFN